MGTPLRVRIRAHAKINLTLHVRGTRDDGYHDLETVFQSLALHDVLTCRLRPGPFSIRCDDPGVPADERNLIWRAAQRLWERLGRRGSVRGVEIELGKQIPMQAGLGGGSADAAAALLALSRMWAAERRVDLAAVAARIGADVPYFLMGGTALGLSRGENLYALPDLPVCHVVVGLPSFGVSTVEAYRWLDEDRAKSSRSFASPVAGWNGGLMLTAGPIDRRLGWSGWSLVVHNDLEVPVARRHPEIRGLRNLLARQGAFAASMTGSGSACFGLFETEAHARAAAQRVAAAGFVALLTKTIGRRTCGRDLGISGR